MRRGVILGLIAASLCCRAPVFAQQQGQAQSAEPSLEERVAQLEGELADLSARLELRTPPGGDTLGAGRDLDAQRRLGELERQLAALTADVRRLQQSVETAMRDASQAQRDAMDAQRAARDAASRPR
jgi:uncharacterized protein YceH (UPF0502 family)